MCTPRVNIKIVSGEVLHELSIIPYKHSTKQVNWDPRIAVIANSLG